MEIRKTLLFSLFMHMCVFTATALISLQIRGGGSPIKDSFVMVRLVSVHDGGRSTAEGNREKASRAVPRAPLSRKKHPVSRKIEEGHDTNVLKATEGEVTTLPIRNGQAGVDETGTEESGSDRGEDTGGMAVEETDTGAGAGTAGAVETPGADAMAGDRDSYVPSEIIKMIRRSIERAKTYPPLARRRGIEGVVYLRFRIDQDGQPVDVRITQSSGSGVLDRGALKILQRAAPLPHVKGEIEVPISFRLRED